MSQHIILDAEKFNELRLATISFLDRFTLGYTPTREDVEKWEELRSRWHAEIGPKRNPVSVKNKSQIVGDLIFWMKAYLADANQVLFSLEGIEGVYWIVAKVYFPFDYGVARMIRLEELAKIDKLQNYVMGICDELISGYRTELEKRKLRDNQGGQHGR